MLCDKTKSEECGDMNSLDRWLASHYNDLHTDLFGLRLYV